MTDKNWMNELTDGFDLEKYTERARRSVDADFHSTHRPVTIWLPLDVRREFDGLQQQTRKGFGKYLREVIITTIEKTAKKA